MPRWPTSDEFLLDEYIRQLPPCNKRRLYRGLMRRFQAFVRERTEFNLRTLRAWLRTPSKRCLGTTLVRAQWVDRYLEWLVSRGAIKDNPFAELRGKYGCRRTAPIARALLSRNYKRDLEAIRVLPRYGSHLGPTMRDHVQRMRTLGFRYGHESRFLRFDRFLQERPGAENETLTNLVREYVAFAPSASEKLLRISVGRIIARALERSGTPTAQPKWDRALVQEMHRKRNRPYIYSEKQVSMLFETALGYHSPYAPLRPLSLYTMLVLAYCAGLRVGEIARLNLQDVDLVAGTIEVRNSKFFKSRRLPLSPTALSALAQYLNARKQAGVSSDPTTALFWNQRRPYSLITTEQLLRSVIRRAGLNTKIGPGGPRVHDLRHTFVVHRMTTWYRQGINPQARLPYLAAYLGHRDIHSTLVYLTITQELLQHASGLLRSAEPEVMKVIQGKP
jgi:site-specific recombinase XerD